MGLLAACSPRIARAPAPNQQLLATWWRVVEIDGSRADFLRGQKMDFSIMLSRQGRLAGSGGCSGIDAAFVRSDRIIRIGRIAVSRSSCPSPVALRERAFIAALRKTETWEVRGRELWFYDRMGSVLLHFVAVRTP